MRNGDLSKPLGTLVTEPSQYQVKRAVAGTAYSSRTVLIRHWQRLSHDFSRSHSRLTIFGADFLETAGTETQPGDRHRANPSFQDIQKCVGLPNHSTRRVAKRGRN